MRPKMVSMVGCKRGRPLKRSITWSWVPAPRAGVLASRLSEDRNVRVALIEAGPMDRHPFIHVPALVGAAISLRSLNWRFMTVPQPNLVAIAASLFRGDMSSEVLDPSMEWCISEAIRPISTAGQPQAIRAGVIAKCCRTSCARKITRPIGARYITVRVDR